jgi:hypothetical protein
MTDHRRRWNITFSSGSGRSGLRPIHGEWFDNVGRKWTEIPEGPPYLDPCADEKHLSY